jgi:hypothetical protein
MTESTPGRIKKRAEEEDENRLGFSIIGKIKIGQKTDKGYPESLDYFRATGPHADAFHKTLGEKPSMLKIVFPTPFAEQCCNQRIEGRDSDGNLAVVSDGVNHKVWDHKSQQYLPADDEKLEEVKKKGIEVIKGYGDNAKKTTVKVNNWNERLTLRFIVLEMKGILGIWELSTNGKASSIPNIIGNFDKMAEQAGRNMRLVPFDLSVAFAKGQKPGSQSRYPVLTLVPTLNYESMLQLQDFKNIESEFNKLLTDDTVQRLIDDGGNNRHRELTGVTQNEKEIEDKEGITDNAIEPIPEVSKDDSLFKGDENIQTGSGKEKAEINKKFTPEKLQEYVRESGKENTGEINSKTIEKLEIALSAITNYNKSDQVLLLKFLTRMTEIEDVSQGEAEAIIKWVNPVEDETGTFVPKDYKRIKQAKEIFELIGNEVEGKLL